MASNKDFHNPSIDQYDDIVNHFKSSRKTFENLPRFCLMKKEITTGRCYVIYSTGKSLEDSDAITITLGIPFRADTASTFNRLIHHGMLDVEAMRDVVSILSNQPLSGSSS